MYHSWHQQPLETFPFVTQYELIYHEMQQFFGMKVHLFGCSCGFEFQQNYCRARLLLLFAQVSKFSSQSLNSDMKGAELTL